MRDLIYWPATIFLILYCSKLQMKMKQPEQFAEWRKQQELAKQLLEKLQNEAK